MYFLRPLSLLCALLLVNGLAMAAESAQSDLSADLAEFARPGDSKAPQIRAEFPAYDFIKEHFSELPISGGWGYTQEDPVIITVDKALPSLEASSKGIAVEYEFVRNRIYEELIILRKPGEQYAGIEWNRAKQMLIGKDGKHYDALIVEVTALPKEKWDELKARWEGPNGYGKPGFDMEAHLKEHKDNLMRYVTVYWFDITDFFGRK